ncbi:MAG: TlpA family protein disulfide reductase [Clostridia bacterium]|nr:TlpA family protein disulfide reductase [Clostridia bacterium]
MKRIVLLLTLLVLVSLTVVGCGGNVGEKNPKGQEQGEERQDNQASGGEVGVGKAAPGFMLEDLNGDENSLGDFRGKTVVLAFWETWCPSCRHELIQLDGLAEKYKDDDLVIITVNTMTRDTPEVIRQFMKENNLDLPVLLDHGSNASFKYMIRWLPSLYIIDSQGVVQYETFGVVDTDLLESEIKNISGG